MTRSSSARGGRAGPITVELFRRLADQRQQLIFDHARPFLDDDEEILEWARARRAAGRGSGFVFITDNRLVIAWARGDGDVAIAWSEVRSWGIDREERGGPVLGVGTDQGVEMAQLVTTTQGLAENARGFIQRFAELAPPTEDSFEVTGETGRFRVLKDVDIAPPHRSAWEISRRIGVTILGVALMVLGIAIIPLPGPWSFLINIGGLAVLASEYDWAKDLLTWTRRKFESAKARVSQRKANKKRA